MHNARILHIITQSVPFGGAQRQTLLTIQGLKRKGYDVELVCGTGPNLANAARESGIPVTTLPLLVREISPQIDIRCLFQLYRIIKEKRFNIIHTHSAKAGLIGRIAAKLAIVPVIIHTNHGNYFTIGSLPFRRGSILLERLAALVTTKLIAIGDLVKDQILEVGICSNSKVKTIYSGMSFNQFDIAFDVSQIRKELGIKPATPVVGTVGHLLEWKGINYFVEAASRIHKNLPDVKFIIVGEGPLRESIEAQVDSLGLNQTVHLLGERYDIPQMLAAMDIFVKPSLREGLGISIIEAMYMKKPVVASNIDGIPELIEDGKTGILIPVKDVSSLVATIEDLLRNRSKAKQLGENARKKVFPKFSADFKVNQIEALYLRLLEKNVQLNQ